MKKIATIFLLLCSPFSKKCIAQDFNKELDSLCVMCNRSSSDSERVAALGRLANHYYIYQLNSKGDSVLHEQLLVAELSNNPNLILQALFGDAILNISPSSSIESFDRTISFAQNGIDYAKSTGKEDYLALGYTRMSEILRKRGDYDKAFSNCIMALTLLQNVTSDSIKSVAYIELGETYLDRGDALSACTNFNFAYDIAVKSGSVPLQSKVHHCLAQMYRKLGDDESAKTELRQSMILNKNGKNAQGLVDDYSELAKITNEKFLIQRSIELSDSLHSFKDLLNAKRLMLVYIYVEEKDAAKALEYLEKEPDVKQSFLNDGIENYYITLGHIYFYTGAIDSALYYYKIAEPELAKNFEQASSMFILEQIAECYRLKNNIPEAITYYQKAIGISIELNDVKNVANYSAKLSGLYEKENDFKNALHYSKQSVVYDDSIRKLSKQNEITLLGVDRENKRHEQELLQQSQKDATNRNIQYFGITISIVIIFFAMLFVGSFPVKPLTVKLMGYFFFISLFEFIVLIIDNLVLYHIIHNQPLKLWLIKIGVIALLVPCQHFLEHRLIGLLASRKLIEVRTKFSVKNWWASLNKQSSDNKRFEEDEAVL
ncbi:MAG TPA: hypothetical protein VIJ57_00390 [Hanamia sp.]